MREFGSGRPVSAHRDGPLVGLIALCDPDRPRGAPRAAMVRAIAPPLPQRHDTGDPEAESQDLAEVRVWSLVTCRGYSSTDWMTTPEFAHEDVLEYTKLLVLQ